MLYVQVAFDCTDQAASYHIRGLSFHDNFAYISAFTPGSLQLISNSISRVAFQKNETKKISDLIILLNRRNDGAS